MSAKFVVFILTDQIKVTFVQCIKNSMSRKRMARAIKAVLHFLFITGLLFHHIAYYIIISFVAFKFFDFGVKFSCQNEVRREIDFF